MFQCSTYRNKMRHEDWEISYKIRCEEKTAIGITLYNLQFLYKTLYWITNRYRFK